MVFHIFSGWTVKLMSSCDVGRLHSSGCFLGKNLRKKTIKYKYNISHFICHPLLDKQNKHIYSPLAIRSSLLPCSGGTTYLGTQSNKMSRSFLFKKDALLWTSPRTFIQLYEKRWNFTRRWALQSAGS